METTRTTAAYLQKKRALEAALEEGRKGVGREFSLKEFLEEAYRRYPELVQKHNAKNGSHHSIANRSS